MRKGKLICYRLSSASFCRPSVQRREPSAASCRSLTFCIFVMQVGNSICGPTLSSFPFVQRSRSHAPCAKFTHKNRHQEQDIEQSLKVIIVGNGMVGKTSMITRFARGQMTDGYKKTIGTGPRRFLNTLYSPQGFSLCSWVSVLCAREHAPPPFLPIPYFAGCSVLSLSFPRFYGKGDYAALDGREHYFDAVGYGRSRNVCRPDSKLLQGCR